ncbi:MAG: glycosyl hydrolase family 65 protein [Pseudomonadota bacterium]
MDRQIEEDDASGQPPGDDAPRSSAPGSDSWALRYDGFDPTTEGLREALCTLGNGRFAVRGADLGADAGAAHYPGTYLAGGYNRLVSDVAGRAIENEDLVNWPNPLPVRIRLDDGDWLTPSLDTIREQRRTLDLRRGVLRIETRLADGRGRGLHLIERRLVSMADPRLLAIELTITPEEDTAAMIVDSALDGGVTNAGVPRYRALAAHHLEVTACDHPMPDIARLVCRTVQSGLEAAMAARTTVLRDGAPVDPREWAEDMRVGHRFEMAVRAGETVRLEKVVAFVTARDNAIASPALTAAEAAAGAPGFGALLTAHERAWDDLWDRFGITLTDHSGPEQQHLTANIFHLLQSLSPHTAEMDAGAPARGWHGEAYRGHIFWDELFIFRALNLREPRLTRALLRYRLRRLPAARRLAEAEGLPGAMYPWQSGSDGREETQTLHLNPKSGRWLPDVSHRQRHVGLAIAYNVWSYYRATGDIDFLIAGGAEMLVEIARFFAALATWDAGLERYRIRGVMGPDEFHTAYPGTDPEAGGGIDDNAYTNVLTAWVLARAADALQHLPPERRERLHRTLALRDDELARWQEVSERLYVPHLSNGLIAQFEGYEALEELDWEAYRATYGDIHRLDRILEAEGKDVNAFKASKQADVLMLPFLFSSEELVHLFEQLGYRFDPNDIPRLVAYYDARTSHGSTLSAVVHAWIQARLNRTRSWALLQKALKADIEDAQGGTTREGIHLGAMCGAIDIVQACYLGLSVHDGALHVDPVLPDALDAIATRVRYQGQDVEIEATQAEVRVRAGAGAGGIVTVSYRGRQRLLAPGAETTFRLVRPREDRETHAAASP